MAGNFSPASCKKILLIHVFAAQNTRFPGLNSVWFKFTASEDKPHAPTVGFSSSFPVIPCHPRESGEKAGIHFNHENPWIPASAGMTDFIGTCSRLDRVIMDLPISATIGVSTARMSASHERSNTLVHVARATCIGWRGEQGIVDVPRGMLRRPPDDHFVSPFAPLDGRAGGRSQLLPNARRYRDPALRSDSGEVIPDSIRSIRNSSCFY